MIPALRQASFSLLCKLDPAKKNAEEKIVAKYSALNDRLNFQPIAVEISGVLGPSSNSFLTMSAQR